MPMMYVAGCEMARMRQVQASAAAEAVMGPRQRTLGCDRVLEKSAQPTLVDGARSFIPDLNLSWLT